MATADRSNSLAKGSSSLPSEGEVPVRKKVSSPGKERETGGDKEGQNTSDNNARPLVQEKLGPQGDESSLSSPGQEKSSSPGKKSLTTPPRAPEKESLSSAAEGEQMTHASNEQVLK